MARPREVFHVLGSKSSSERLNLLCKHKDHLLIFFLLVEVKKVADVLHEIVTGKLLGCQLCDVEKELAFSGGLGLNQTVDQEIVNFHLNVIVWDLKHFQQ